MNEPIKLMIVIDPNSPDGFDVVDQVSGRIVAGITRVKFDSGPDMGSRLSLDLWAFDEKGNKYIGDKCSLDYECGRGPETIIDKD